MLVSLQLTPSWGHSRTERMNRTQDLGEIQTRGTVTPHKPGWTGLVPGWDTSSDTASLPLKQSVKAKSRCDSQLLVLRTSSDWNVFSYWLTFRYFPTMIILDVRKALIVWEWAGSTNVYRPEFVLCILFVHNYTHARLFLSSMNCRAHARTLTYTHLK